MSPCLRRFLWKKRFAAEPINRSLPIPASSKLAETYFVKQELAAKRLWIGLEGPPDCSGPAQLIRCKSATVEQVEQVEKRVEQADMLPMY